jgi:hypothetical protein
MTANDIGFYASILSIMKEEHEKRNVLYEHGVDLLNYNDMYYNCLMNVLVYNLDMDMREPIEWWLYEDVEKVVEFNGVEYDVSNPVDFLKLELSSRGIIDDYEM